jgi:hypothetical protein
MTASFNVISSDGIDDYEAQVEKTVNKLRKIFSATVSVFNKQQLAFILNSLGWVDELDDDFHPKQPEDATFLSIFFTALKSKSGGIKLRTLKKSLAMLNALQVNKVFAREPKKSTVKSPRATKTSLSNRQQSPNILSSYQSNEINKCRSADGDKIDFRVESRGKTTPPSLEPAGNLTIEEIFNERQPSDREIHFSFKKVNHGQQESNVSDAFIIQELQGPNGINLNGLLEHQSLLLESKDPSRFARLLLERVRSEKERGSVPGDAASFAKKQVGPRLIGKLGGRGSEGGINTGLRELLSPDSYSKRLMKEREPSRPKFLFGSVIIFGGKTHNVKIYEGEDLKEKAVKFAQENGVDLEKCLSIFGKIEQQRLTFVKNFQIIE